MKKRLTIALLLLVLPITVAVTSYMAFVHKNPIKLANNTNKLPTKKTTAPAKAQANINTNNLSQHKISPSTKNNKSLQKKHNENLNNEKGKAQNKNIEIKETPSTPTIKDSNNSYLPYLELSGTRFFNVASSNTAAGVDLFIPLWQTSSNHLVFTQARVYDRSGKPFEGNIHFGYRYLAPEKDHMYGIYGSYDRKRTEFGNYFNQLTLGAEGWFQKLFIGGNIYYPFGKTSRLLSINNEELVYDYAKNKIWITQDKKYEKAMGGADVEFGYEFTKGLVGYVGGYYFGSQDVNTIYGPKAKLNYDFALENG
ncbi:MAG: inverse autotransporter beta domain-containing protein, partial [Gammaproteobacteria bacterium]|nr:inverse autotransporter beta domain-containing protein [Gammaproteobacteria bacterium]